MNNLLQTLSPLVTGMWHFRFPRAQRFLQVLQPPPVPPKELSISSLLNKEQCRWRCPGDTSLCTRAASRMGVSSLVRPWLRVPFILPAGGRPARTARVFPSQQVQNWRVSRSPPPTPALLQRPHLGSLAAIRPVLHPEPCPASPAPPSAQLPDVWSAVRLRGVHIHGCTFSLCTPAVLAPPPSVLWPPARPRTWSVFQARLPRPAAPAMGSRTRSHALPSLLRNGSCSCLLILPISA